MSKKKENKCLDCKHLPNLIIDGECNECEKAMTPLQTLGKIHDNWNCMNPNSNDCDNNDFKLIENALKSTASYVKRLKETQDKLYETEKERNRLGFELANTSKELADTENGHARKLKALEIIKKKRVDVDLLISFIERGDKTLSLGVLGTYNLEIDNTKHLTQEEYDLLREVLCDDK